MRRRPGRTPRLVLWFGLDASIADTPVRIPAGASASRLAS
jgi:hypothetical protein